MRSGPTSTVRLRSIQSWARHESATASASVLSLMRSDDTVICERSLTLEERVLSIEWGAEPAMSDMEALMWRSEASPRLRSGGVILDVLDHAADWDRFVAAHEWAVDLIPRLRQHVVEDPLRLNPPTWA